jgi:competence protein ComEC
MSGALTAIYRRSFIIAAMLTGVAFAWFSATTRLAEDLPPALEGADVEIEGCIATLPERGAGFARFGFAVDRARDGIPPRIQLTWYDAPAELAAADCLVVEARLRGRRGFANPAGFDYEAFLFANGIGATGYVKSYDAGSLRAHRWRFPLLTVRSWLTQRILQAVDSPLAAVVASLATGERGGITPQQWQILAASGTSHLLAISGLHIGIVAGLANLAARRSLRRVNRSRRNARDLAMLAALAAACTYAALAGFALPTQRALAMLGVFALARLSRRVVSASTIIAIAAVAVLLLDPFAPLSIGAWLSFGAVAAIFWAAGGRIATGTRRSRFIAAQWAVTLGLMPLLVKFFGTVSIVAPLANLVAIPLFAIAIVPLVLAGTVLAACSADAGAIALLPAAWMLQMLFAGLAWLASLPFATVPLPDLGIVGFTALAVLACIATGPAPRALRAVALTACAALMFRAPASVAPGTFELTILDVGQGLATVVRTRRHTLLYDAGPAFRSGRDAGDLVVVPALRALGVRHLDRIIASHGDLDHVGGLHAVLRALPHSDVRAGTRLAAGSIAAGPCVRGTTWQWDGVSFRILHPPAGGALISSDNDASCVLEIAAGSQRALLTGDIEAVGEAEILHSGLLRSAAVVVAPHHGSATSSSAAFVSTVQPELVVFSVGHRNRWGFPRADVVERWRASGATTLSTDRSGAVTLRIDGSGLQTVSEARLASRHYWRR